MTLGKKTTKLFLQEQQLQDWKLHGVKFFYCLYFIFFFNGKPPLFLFMASKKCNFYLLAKLCLIIK